MIEALKAIAVFEPLAYLVLLYSASRLAAVYSNGQQRFVVDIIFVVWVLCSILREIMGASVHVALAYMIVDIIAALWLSARVRGKVSGIAETFFLAMILANFSLWYKGDGGGWAHWTMDMILSVGQIICVLGGIMRNELRGIADRAAARLHLRIPVAFHKDKTGGEG